jgi:hypothetical protein
MIGGIPFKDLLGLLRFSLFHNFLFASFLWLTFFRCLTNLVVPSFFFLAFFRHAFPVAFLFSCLKIIKASERILCVRVIPLKLSHNQE